MKLIILLVYSVSSQIFSLTQNDHCLKDRSPDCQGEFNRKQVNSALYRGVSDVYTNANKCVIYKHRSSYKICKYKKDIGDCLKRGLGHYKCRRSKEIPRSPFECKEWQRMIRSCRNSCSANSRRCHVQILPFSDNECKINAKMELQWSNTLIQERMRDKRKVNITILLHSQEMDGMTPVIVNQAFLPDLQNGDQFEHDFFYQCPKTAQTYNLATISFDGGFETVQATGGQSALNNMDLIFNGMNVYEHGQVTEFRYGLPIPFLNTLGLPQAHYFQGEDVAKNDAQRLQWLNPNDPGPPDVAWFKNLELPYVKKLLNYNWETEPMPDLQNPNLLRMFHFKPSAVPPFMIPRELFWEQRRDASFKKQFEIAKQNTVLIQTKQDTHHYDTDILMKTPAFKYRGICKKCEKDNDETFVFRQINGYRPKGIKLLKEKLSWLQFPSSMQGTIDRDISNKKIFIIDCSVLSKLTNWEPGYAPTLILKLENRRLRPMFIQTYPDSTGYVFTPEDREYEWKLAKRLFEGMNSMVQTLSEHLLQSHLVVEVFATAAYRTFSYNHPVYKLLYPHIKQIISINTYARFLKPDRTWVEGPDGHNGLFGMNGFIMRASPLSYDNQFELFHEELKEWSPEVMDLPKYLKDNGLTDDIFDFQYSLRDDGLLYWDAIEEYVTSVVDFFFDNSKEAVYFDLYIGVFLNEVKTALQMLPGVQKWFAKKLRKDAREELITLATSIIWQSTAGHTIENNPIWDYGGNPNIAPWKLAKPLPKSKPRISTLREYEAYLPSMHQFTEQLELMFALTASMDDTENFDEFKHLWVEPNVVGFTDKFQERIREINAQVERNHEMYPIPSPYFWQAKARIDI